MADDSPNPYWKDSPSDNANQPLTPLMLNDAPADLAQSLRGFVAEGASHIQIHLDPTTSQTIERLAPVLEALDAG